MSEYQSLKALIDQIFADESYELIDEVRAKQKDLLANEKIISREVNQLYCPRCHSSSFYRNGHTKIGKQKFLCKDCGKSFSTSTHTVLHATKRVYFYWVRFIHLSIIGLTLKQISEELSISIKTAFIWRHKLFEACSHLREQIKLKGQVEIDAMYRSINLKGTKPEKMPRKSKKRSSSIYRGISRHQVCIMTAIDENDQLIMKIAGIGPESLEKAEVLTEHLDKDVLLVSDMKTCYIGYAKKHEWELQTIKSKGHTNETGYNLATINGIHSEYEVWSKRFRGISIKHLQGYLDMFTLSKLLGYRFEGSKEKDTFIFNEYLTSATRLLVKDIFLKPIPIDLKAAYSHSK